MEHQRLPPPRPVVEPRAAGLRGADANAVALLGPEHLRSTRSPSAYRPRFAAIPGTRTGGRPTSAQRRSGTSASGSQPSMAASTTCGGPSGSLSAHTAVSIASRRSRAAASSASSTDGSLASSRAHTTHSARSCGVTSVSTSRHQRSRRAVRATTRVPTAGPSTPGPSATTSPDDVLPGPPAVAAHAQERELAAVDAEGANADEDLVVSGGRGRRRRAAASGWHRWGWRRWPAWRWGGWACAQCTSRRRPPVDPPA